MLYWLNVITMWALETLMLIAVLTDFFSIKLRTFDENTLYNKVKICTFWGHNS